MIELAELLCSKCSHREYGAGHVYSTHADGAMSGAVSGLGFPELGRVIANMTRTKQNFDTLSQQASSGLISGNYAGLNSTASVALMLSSQIDSLKTTQKQHCRRKRAGTTHANSDEANQLDRGESAGGYPGPDQ